jgi:hypothetical protein
LAALRRLRPPIEAGSSSEVGCAVVAGRRGTEPVMSVLCPMPRSGTDFIAVSGSIAFEDGGSAL